MDFDTVKIDQKAIDDIVLSFKQKDEHKVMFGYLTGRINDRMVTVEGVYIPRQESSHACASVDAQHFASDLRAIMALGQELVGVAQYNCEMAAFQSKTIEKSKKEIMKKTGCPDILLVVNSKGQYNLY